MSQLSVSYGRQALKIRVTPGQIMQEVLNKCVSAFKLENPNQYEFRHGKNSVDLSLPFRLSGLPAGAKLQLVEAEPRANSTDNPVTVKIVVLGTAQITSTLPNSVFVNNFKNTTKIWTILCHFEKIVGNLRNDTKFNITKRIYSIENGPNDGYEAPIVQLFNKELRGIPQLCTTLAELGITSGNCLLRVRFEKTSERLSDVQTEYPELFRDDFVVEENSEVVGKAETAEKAENHVEAESEKIVDSELQNDAKAETIPPKAEIISDKPEKIPEVSTISNNLSDFSTTNNSNSDISISAEPTSSDNRKMEIFHPSEPSISSASSPQLNDDSYLYEMTVSEAQLYQKILSSKAHPSGDKMLSRAAREAQKEHRNNPITECIVRFRFPDQNQVQAVFRPDEKVSDLSAFVNSVISDISEFQLLLPAPPRILSDPSAFLVADCGFGPRTIVLVEPKNSGDNVEVRKELIAESKDISELTEVKIERELRAIPKEEITEAEVAESGNKTEKMTGGKRGGNAGLEGSEGSMGGKKIPKWLKIGKK